MPKEIKIIGAGISGLSSAIHLAKAGYKVKIFEKNDIVGKRFHGDYQGIENWSYKQDALEHIKSLNIELNFPYYPIKNINVVGPEKSIYEFKFDKPVCYLVRRGTEKDSLDQKLYEQAKNLGVEFVFNSPRDHKKFGDIIAQGYFPDKVTDAIVLGYNFDTNASDQCWVIIDDDIAPDGYNYCLIANGKATLAICIFKNYKKSYNYLSQTFKIFEKFINFKAKNIKQFSGTSNSFRMKTAIFNNRLYVGESAGFIDGAWGFGIKFALISGHLAAESIIKNKNYDNLWKKHIKPQLEASLINRWLYKTMNNKIYSFILKKAKQSKNPFGFLAKTGSYCWVHKIAFPFAFLFLRKKHKDRRRFN